jgi:hypothetical protein
MNNVAMMIRGIVALAVREFLALQDNKDLKESKGPQGIQGSQGLVGSIQSFAYIYSTIAQTVANGGSVLFNSPATLASILFTPPSTTIALTSPGSYLISFEICVHGL